MPDFTYTEQNGFITLMPENQEAIEVWNVMSDFTQGSGKFLKSDLKNIKAQLKAKGYIVKKATKTKSIDDAELLALLG